MQRLPGYIDNPLPPPPQRPPPRPPLPPHPSGERPPPVNYSPSGTSRGTSSGSSTNPFDLPPPPNPFEDQPDHRRTTVQPSLAGTGVSYRQEVYPPPYEYSQNEWVSATTSDHSYLDPQRAQRHRVRTLSERAWSGEPSTFMAPTMAFPIPDLSSISSYEPPSPQLPTQKQPPIPPQTSYLPSRQSNGTPSAPVAVSGPSNTPTTLERASTASVTSSSSSYHHQYGASVSRSSSASATAPTPSSGSSTAGSRRPSQPHVSKSDNGFSPNLIKLQHNYSVASFQSTNSYTKNPDSFQDALASPVESASFFDDVRSAVASELSDLSQDMEENIRRFQAGELSEADEEWHRLVPQEALKTLEQPEVDRQNMIFELFKAEREYVHDLELTEEVFMRGLREARPPIILEHQVNAWINDVFGNIHEILMYHKDMLESLFQRQREDHPLVNSIADIVLETVLKPEFRDAYEKYIKNYPMAESIHQKQLKSNPQYIAFLQSVSSNPRIKKRDFKIFLNRPVARLPRLNLLLNSMLKKTDKEHDHPDLDILPIVVGVVEDSIKASQPGIEAAESRVKFMDICEHLVYPRGEIVDLDLFDKERHLVHVGPVWVRIKPESGFSSEKWDELNGVLLDNYFILYREKKVSPSVTKKHIQYRPISLSFVRLASFTSDPDIRKEKSDEGSLLDTFRTREVPMYPFTFYHASPTSMKAYKLYVISPNQRKRWHEAFVDALGVHQVKQESNPWFAQKQLSDGYFRIPREALSPHTRATGKLTSAVPFTTLNDKRFLAIACASGIYVSPYGTDDFRKVFDFPGAHYIAALQGRNNTVDFDKFIIHFDTGVLAYSLASVALTALGEGDPYKLEATRERVTPPDQSVMLIRHVIVGDRVLLIYASKKRMSSSCYVHALEAVATTVQRGSSKPTSFRPFGQTGTIPKDAYDIVSLTRSIGICTRDGLVTADPANLASSAAAPIPILSDAYVNPSNALLKSQIEGSKPLGFVRVSREEVMVIYDNLGCFVNTRGIPMRNGGYVKWETKATSYAFRAPHLFLVSPRFIETRNVGTGRLLQVIEGGDIRLLYSEPVVSPVDNVLVAMRGRHNDPQGLSEKIVELTETEDLQSNRNGPSQAAIWAEWDMN